MKKKNTGGGTCTSGAAGMEVLLPHRPTPLYHDYWRLPEKRLSLYGIWSNGTACTDFALLTSVKDAGIHQRKNASSSYKTSGSRLDSADGTD